ncbi:S-methyl-5'-thioadenosine phosphorylase [Alicyclobacillus fastidiosus]|uniref:Probable 6-oxopurine nucleoside phosphorylase n=1 Tax=Alicyclobacillus fastidiosus TaxID=392011 RepID=A0ABV5AAR5_9BACL|nr:S-methyl-5'-thioadenosine phosphorylase [Alicyclobacillus fastidiosus]WEH11872.1 S-methyl-5'-thioadenosine phosphorylase [Alicyclobacillus fastidiosus]
MQPKYAIIGGTGVYEPGAVEDARDVEIHTPYGDVPVTIGGYGGQAVAFLARHGKDHATPPHKVNYRANIYALKDLGVEQVLATAAVGSLQPGLKPGDLVLVDDVIDMSKSRVGTFFERDTVVHVDMSDPYCNRLRRNLTQIASRLNYAIHAGGVYVSTEGPRFETKAEIRMFQRLGGSVVGMTSMPEVALAKEAELCYATVCMVTNYAAGLTTNALTHQEVVDTMRDNVDKIRTLFYEFIQSDRDERTCDCKRAVGGQTPLKREEQ